MRIAFLFIYFCEPHKIASRNNYSYVDWHNLLQISVTKKQLTMNKKLETITEEHVYTAIPAIIIESSSSIDDDSLSNNSRAINNTFDNNSIQSKHNLDIETTTIHQSRHDINNNSNQNNDHNSSSSFDENRQLIDDMLYAVNSFRQVRVCLYKKQINSFIYEYIFRLTKRVVISNCKMQSKKWWIMLIKAKTLMQLTAHRRIQSNLTRPRSVWSTKQCSAIDRYICNWKIFKNR